MYPLAEQWSFITSLKVSTLAASTFGPHSLLICSWRIHAVMWIQIHIEFGSEFRILAQFGSGLCYKFRLNNLNNFRENHFTFKKYFVSTNKNKMSPKEIVSQLSLWIEFYTFCLYFILYLHICLDPDPYSEYWFGSTKLVKTDPVRIRIHIA